MRSNRNRVTSKATPLNGYRVLIFRFGEFSVWGAAGDATHGCEAPRTNRISPSAAP
jgi:hypothetical protein